MHSRKSIILIGTILVLLAVILLLFRIPRANNRVTSGPLQRTFALIKPEAIQNKVSGKIIDLIEQNGFTVIGLRKVKLDQPIAEKFYAIHKGKPFYDDLISYIASGPVIIMALEKEDAIKDWRDLMGATNPASARPGTIRKLYGTDIQKNAIHGSDSEQSAKAELELFFPNL